MQEHIDREGRGEGNACTSFGVHAGYGQVRAQRDIGSVFAFDTRALMSGYLRMERGDREQHPEE